ncbi:MAG: RelA/SpoT domain-containing protein, partial [Thermoplasmata archaeon]|nr:RelA/SpoT domain-containing protein [Thermoplasmata archaeon]
MTVDPEWLKEQVNKYTKNELSRYKTYAKALEKILLRACEKCEVMGIVQTRAKAIPSFAEKAIRKAHKYDDPSYQLTDLCGGRVICQTQTEVEQICQFIKDNFNVDEANSLDVGARLKTEEFGYRAVHYVVQIDPYNKIMLDVVKRINDKEREKGKKGKIIDIQKDFGKRKAEIQVQTLLQHAWAGMYHDRIYKSELQVPVRFKRELARVAA